MKCKLLAIPMILLILTSCGNDDSDTQTAEPQFDWMPEAFQEIYLFGHRISLPGTVNEWGEDFSLDERYAISVPNENNLVIDLLYQGNDTDISVVLLNCSKDDDDKENKQIIDIHLGSLIFSLPPSDSIDIDFRGITFDSTFEEVMELLDIPTRNEESQNSHHERYITYENSEYEFIQIRFREGRIWEMRFSVERLCF